MSFKKPLENVSQNCDDIGKLEPGSTNAMGAKVQEMIMSYYKDARMQAQQSFYIALIASSIGVVFFIYAAMTDMPKEYVHASLIAGTIVQIISGINFVLYGKAAHQFSLFHVCLERTNRFLLANTICENISNPEKRDTTRHELIIKMANASMITFEAMNKTKADSVDVGNS